MKIQTIKTNSLHPDPEQPRKTFTGIAELAESIKSAGVLVPLIVSPDNQIIDGERRWQAAKEAGLAELPCLIMEKAEYAKPGKRLQIQIIVNEMRARINVIEKLRAWKTYVDLGNSERDLARLLGKNQKTVNSFLKLLRVAPLTLRRLEKDDKNWSWHLDLEDRGSKISKEKRDRMHARIFEGAYENQRDLRETIKMILQDPDIAEKIVAAVSPIERQMVMVGSKAQRSENKFTPKQRSEKEKEEDTEKRVVAGLINSLNQVNMSRVLWVRTDAISLIRKHLTKKEQAEIISSVQTVVKVWSKTK